MRRRAHPKGVENLRAATTVTLAVTSIICTVAAIAFQPDAVAAVAVLPAGAAAFWATRHWERPMPRPVVVVCLVVASVVALAGWLLHWGTFTPVPLALVIGAVACHRERPWQTAALLLAAVHLPGLGLLALDGLDPDELSTWVRGTGASVVMAGVIIANRYAWAAVLEVERARELAGYSASLEERHRLARDLHDIQGQTLVAIGLRLDLALKAIERDRRLAEQEIRAARELVSTVPQETRRILSQDTGLSLEGELVNARQLLEAKGTEVDLRREGLVPEESRAVVSRILREATANIVRHADPDRVLITVSPTRLRLSNDGVRQQPRGPRGLAELGRQIESEGWTLEVEHEDGWFVLDAHRGGDG
ncbi:hypothetical protein GCM10027055_00530 [Janibacter alkaliphilus]|uniref:Two-component system sensor histidine kinase DesK n=1 Tax=Janibacter alkaliphilus TaxID=1069963 RepID=A0A852X039_9MICO|nr:two-component system sensor histidine kinase DesK [Janibacter alkaliphilus]